MSVEFSHLEVVVLKATMLDHQPFLFIYITIYESKLN